MRKIGRKERTKAAEYCAMRGEWHMADIDVGAAPMPVPPIAEAALNAIYSHSSGTPLTIRNSHPMGNGPGAWLEAASLLRDGWNPGDEVSRV